MATIQEGHNLELEIHVERGIGYRPVDRKSEETTAIDLLQIDAVFMPVKRVNFTIDETAVAEGGTGQERLKMEVVTDGHLLLLPFLIFLVLFLLLLQQFHQS